MSNDVLIFFFHNGHGFDRYSIFIMNWFTMLTSNGIYGVVVQEHEENELWIA